jgi:hypothetical protein
MVMWSYAKKGATFKVEEYLRKRSQWLPKENPNRLTFNCLIVAYATSIEIQRKNTLVYRFMVNGQYMKTPLTKRMLKHYGMKEEQDVLTLVFTKCRSYFDQMVQSGWVPNSKTVNTLLHVYLKTRQPLDEILTFFHQNIEQPFLNQNDTAIVQQSSAEPFHYILHQHREVQASKMNEGNDHHHSMDSAVLDQDSHLANPKAIVDTTTLNLLMAIHLRRQDFEKALDAMDRLMPSWSIQPDQMTFAMMIDRSVDLQRPEMGELMVNALKKIRKQRGPLLGGLVVDGSPLEHALIRLKERRPNDVQLVKDIDWLRSGKRLPPSLFIKKQK